MRIPSRSAGDPPRVVAVSGGSSGIGRACAAAFVAAGWKVALGGRRVERVDAAVAELTSGGAEAFGTTLDVCDDASIESFFDAAEAALGRVTAVVNCAAHARPGPLHELSPEEIRAEIETGLVGSLLFARAGICRWIERAVSADVVFISSTSAETPWPLHTPYAASKAGVEQAARSLSVELEGTGIRSLVIRVGNTVGTGWIDEWNDQERMATAEWQRLGLLRHFGLLRPEQIARTIVWAVSAPRGGQINHISVDPEAPLDPTSLE